MARGPIRDQCVTVLSLLADGPASSALQQAVRPVTHTFTVSRCDATTVPCLLGWLPRAMRVTARSPVMATFCVPMNHASVQSNLVITPSQTGAFSCVGNKVIFKPSADWQPGQTYRVTIRTGAYSSAGLHMAQAATWIFQRP